VRHAPAEDHEAHVLHDRLVSLVDELGACDSAIRARQAGAVHRMRVTLRRLRSLLATFGPLYDADTVGALREDLKWVAGELGPARDAEVVRQRLTGLAESAEERAVVARVDEQLDLTEHLGISSSVALLDSDCYAQVVGDLTAFAADPPWSLASVAEDDVLRRRTWRDWKRLRHRADLVDEVPDDHRPQALHEVRKAAKRLRYATEGLVPTYGGHAKRLSHRAERLQTVLGDVQDGALAQETLRRLAAQPGWTPREVFVLGVLEERDRARVAEAEARYEESWLRITRKKNRRWLRRPGEP